MQQTTIANNVKCSGVGLHSGKMVFLGLRPAAEDAGIIFNIATPQGVRRLAPAPGSVIATGLATTLGNGEASVATVEHLLAAIRGLGIDNINIDIEGGEVPIMDGSAASFVMLFKDAGLRRQSRPRKVARITRPLSHSHNGKSISVKPYAGFKVDYTIDFPHPAIGVQRMVLDVTPQSFAEIARARTFGFLSDVEAMRAAGLALGGSLENAVVLDECGVVNNEGLRFADEFVRHKILDFVGDMANLDLPLQGHFTARCSGHAMNNQFLRVLADNRDLYLETVTLQLPEVASPRDSRSSVRPPAVAPAMARQVMA